MTTPAGRADHQGLAGGRLPRALHPLAWWVWAGGLAIAASQVTNPLLLAITLAVLAAVVAGRRGEAPWARAFRYYFAMALVVIAIRVAARIVFGGDVGTAGDHIWLRLPAIPLPSWAAGIRLGGPVSAEGTVDALCGGMMLGTMLCCVGAANALANPKRALRMLPGALYELGVAVVVAWAVAPQLIESVQRVNRARRLRGRTGLGVRAVREVAIPVLEDALSRSLRLAAAMDSRGYGRTGTATRGSRRATAGLMMAGMAGLCAGAFGLLDRSAPADLGLPALGGGALLCLMGLALGGRRVARSHYRPDPWGLAETVVAVGGIVPAAAVVWGTGYPAGSVLAPTAPLGWPALPVLPTVVLLFAGACAAAAPPPPRSAPRPSPVRDPAPAPMAETPVGWRRA